MVQSYALSDFKIKETGVLPPYSNTGGLRTEFTLRPDYLTLSIPAFYLKIGMAEWCSRLFFEFCSNFEGGTRLEKCNPRNGFKHGYRLVSPFDKELVAVFWGGQRGRVYIEIKGGGCRHIDAWQWLRIYRLASRYNARINRFDLAGDDWEGKHFFIPQIKADYEKDKRCIMPAYVRGNNHLPIHEKYTPKGDTLDFGTDTSTLWHCVYQKFRESSDTDLARRNPKWMRWEVRFRRQSKVELDLSMLHPDNWGSAYLGSSVYLQQIFGKTGDKFLYRLEDKREDTLDRFVSAYTAFSNQWGGFVGVCHYLGLEVPSRRFDDTSVFASLTPYDKGQILERLSRASDRSGPASGCPVAALEEVAF